MDGEVLANFNKPTKIGKAIWFVRAQLHLGCGKTKLSELNVHSVKKLNDPIIREEEPSDPPPPPDIPEDTPIDSCLRVNATAVPDEGSETPNKEEPPPIPTVPHNPEEVITEPHNVD